MNISKVVGFTTLMLMSASFVHANVIVEFIEGAPKDRFVVTNTGQCLLQGLRVDIDLMNTAGGLIFDTTATGAGVQVFQPFEVSSGDIALNVKARVNDGDTELSITVASIQPMASVGFTIDVDDTVLNSELGMIIVSAAEMEGGMVTVTQGSFASSGVFGHNSSATVIMASCK